MRDAALYPLKIREIFQYFGKLLGLTDLEILTRSKEPKLVLDLNDLGPCVSSLSGGQRRRVSLGVALINHPKLLVLDEPTVGIDPLLRESIWDYLCSLTATKGTTIIVTTHYTEEARRFNKIGIMRKGRLIGDDSPNNLIHMHGGNRLDDVLLNLCKINDESNMNSFEPIASYKKLDDKLNTDSLKTVELISYKKLEYSKCFSKNDNEFVSRKDNPKERLVRQLAQFSGSLTKIKALTKRNLLMSYRIPSYILMALLLPLIHSIIILYTWGRDPVGQILAVSNQDGICHPGVGLSIRARFEYPWSCGFLEDVMNDAEQKIILKVYESKEAARHSVEIGDTLGFIHFPRNFSQHNFNRLVLHRFATSETLAGSTVQISLDMTKTLQGKYSKFMEKMVSRINAHMDLRQIRTPLRFNNDNSTSDRGEWKDYFLPGNIPLMIFFYSVGCSLALIQDKEDGTLKRSQACGVELWHVYVSYYLSEVLIMLGQIGIVFMSRFLFGEYTNKGSFWLCFVIAFLSGWVAISTGLLVATVLSRSMEVIMVMGLVMLTTVYSCGFSWPLDSVTKPYRWICMYLNPISPPMMATRRVWNSAWGIEHPIIFGALLGSITWIIFLTSVGLIVERRQRNK
ncbi:ABC transporter G family member 20 isoform X2 [Folsomia candida]|uniref:ABC transporter G family member 20 isoform X2 n=1 Tax=Folsomia candida TaxID=158441 RepID=UPI001604DA3D|nr:ABC transporter G family member 20 isoform X2 [Folsomia candida]